MDKYTIFRIKQDINDIIFLLQNTIKGDDDYLCYLKLHCFDDINNRINELLKYTINSYDISLALDIASISRDSLHRTKIVSDVITSLARTLYQFELWIIEDVYKLSRDKYYIKNKHIFNTDTNQEYIPTNYKTKVVQDNKQILRLSKGDTDFRSLIQYSDKDKLLNRLHELIDGKRPIDIAPIISKAKIDNYLIRLPNEAEFRSEFEMVRYGWESVRKNLVTEHDKETDKRKIAAQGVVIF